MEKQQKVRKIGFKVDFSTRRGVLVALQNAVNLVIDHKEEMPRGKVIIAGSKHAAQMHMIDFGYVNLAWQQKQDSRGNRDLPRLT